MAVNWLNSNEVNAWRTQAVQKWSEQEVDAVIKEETAKAKANQPAQIAQPVQPTQQKTSFAKDFIEGTPDDSFLTGLGKNIVNTFTGMPRIVGEAANQVIRKVQDKNLTKRGSEFYRLSAKIEDGTATEDDLNRFITINQARARSFDPMFIKKNELEQISGDVGKGVLLGAKKGAGTASFLMPGGIAGGTTKQVMLQGAKAGALAGFGQEQEDLSLSGSLVDAATGTLTGAVTAGALKKTGDFLKYVKKASPIEAVKSKVSKKLIVGEAAKRIHKATPTKVREVIEHLGKSPDELTTKYWPKGAGYDDMLGPISKKGRGGVFKKGLDDAGKQIDDAINSAGKGRAAPRIGIDDFIDDLKKELKAIKKIPGNERAAKALEKFIKNTKQLYKKGLTPTQANNLKKAIDSDFGRKVVDERTGSVAAQGQKRLANYLRGELKTLLPDVSDALDTQSEILTLRPLISNARSILQAQGSEIRRGSIDSIFEAIDPFKLSEAALQHPEVASRFLSKGGKEAVAKVGEKAASKTTTELKQRALRGAGGRLSSPELLGGQAQDVLKQALTASTPPVLATTAVLGNKGNVPDLATGEGLQNTEISPRVAEMVQKTKSEETPKASVTLSNGGVIDRDKLFELRMQYYDNPAITKQLNSVEKELERLEEKQPERGFSNVGKVTPEILQKSLTGASALDNFEKIVFNSDGTVNREAIVNMNLPGAAKSQESRQARANLYRVAESFLRLDTGAAAQKEEIERQADALVPGVTDSPETIRAKLLIFRNTFTAINELAQQNTVSLDSLTQ